MTASTALRLATAICLCGCLLCADTFQPACDTELARPTVEPEQGPFTYEEFHRLLIDHLGIGADDLMLNYSERLQLFLSLPDFVHDRISRWNQREETNKTEKYILIGTPKTVLDSSRRSQSGWAFVIDRSVTIQRIRKVTIIVDLIPDSQIRGKTLRLSVYKINANSSSISLTLLNSQSVAVAASNRKDLFVDLSSAVIPVIKSSVKAGKEEVGIFVLVECPDCPAGNLSGVKNVLVDLKFRFDRTPSSPKPVADRVDITTSSPVREAEREPWLFRPEPSSPKPVADRDDITTISPTSETDHLPWPFRKVKGFPPKNISEEQREQQEQREQACHGVWPRTTCCLETETLSTSVEGESAVVMPSAILLSYCRGRCGARSKARNAYEKMRQIIREDHPNELDRDSYVYCVPNSFRDLQLLTAVRKPGGGIVLGMRIIKYFMAAGCTCD